MNTQENVNPPAPQPSTRGQPYQFSNEELRVLKECNRDSFFQRCLPISTLLGIATYYGVQGGHLKPSPRWGAAPKVIAATIIGYFIGKVSYQTKCAEKLMQLPDSKLGAILRQRKRGAGFQETLEPGIGHGMSLSPFSSINPGDTYSDVGPAPSSSIDIDTTRPDQNGLDDSLRPTVDFNPISEEEHQLPIPQNKTTTYEELRQQNREEYQRQRSGAYKGITPSADVPPVRRPTVSFDTDPSTSTTKKSTNIYGDIME